MRSPSQSAARFVRSEDAPALAAAVLAVLLWASAFVAIRYVDRRLAPGALALGRLLIGSVALGGVVLIRREALPRGRVLARIAVCGFLWFGLYNVVLNEAELRVDAGTAALLVNTGPIMIAILAGALLGEGFPPRLFLGCLVSFGGAALIGAAVSGVGSQGGWGVVLCLIAALAYAGGVVAQKPALQSASALSVTWLACTVGALCCLPYAPELASQVVHGRASTAGWVIYLGIAPTAIGFVSWAYALSRTTAGRMGSTTYLVPPLAVLLGWTLLGEAPPLLALPGGLACLAGVAISRSRPASTGNASAGVVPPRSLPESSGGRDHIAVSEPCANGIEHAYSPAPAGFELDAKIADGKATLTVRDQGRWRPTAGDCIGGGDSRLSTPRSTSSTSTPPRRDGGLDAQTASPRCARTGGGQGDGRGSRDGP